MNKLFTTGQVKEINVEERRLTAYASTRDVDRDGDVILPDSWRKSITTFESVPLMWAHEYNVPPVGKATNFKIDAKGLLFDATFADTTFANEIWKLYQDGFLDSFSVGFRPLKWDEGGEKGASRTFIETELLEVSAVPVPANPHARIERGVPTIAFKSIQDFELVAEIEVLETDDEGDEQPTAGAAGNAAPEDDNEPETDNESALLSAISDFLTNVQATLEE